MLSDTTWNKMSRNVKNERHKQAVIWPGDLVSTKHDLTFPSDQMSINTFLAQGKYFSLFASLSLSLSVDRSRRLHLLLLLWQEVAASSDSNSWRIAHWYGTPPCRPDRNSWAQLDEVTTPWEDREVPGPSSVIHRVYQGNSSVASSENWPVLCCALREEGERETLGPCY